MIKPIFLSLTLIIFSCCEILAQSGTSIVDGLYFNAHLPYHSTEGDLKGNSILQTSKEIFLVPQVEPGTGLGFTIGTRKGNLAVEFSYDRTNHMITFNSAEGEATLTTFSLDYKFFMLQDKKLQPYLDLGWVPFATLRVKDAAATIATEPVVSDAKYTGGIGAYKIGIGVLVIPIKWIMLHGEFNYRLSRYRSVASGDDFLPIEIEKPLKGNGMNFAVGLSFRLPKRQ